MTLTSNPRNQPPSYAKCQSDLHAARETIKGYEAASHQAMTMLAIATATADRLRSCEKLLLEIHDALGRSIKRADRNASQTIRFERLESADLKRRIDALLGPAATEGGG